ncbi:MAG: MBL fold metallo-hydrolase [Ilumatobacteraceae bacterium]|nr:MBL fold metallo-hydrolase [Ilumatobacteraceae bacterium]
MGDVTDTTRAAIAAMAATLPTHDQQDVDDATRGFVARSEQRRITAADGRVVWDLDAYEFLRGADAPDTANPSLWRQGQLLIEDGLFEVVPGIYQLRGFDLSVMSVIEGDTGVIVIDPLISSETAAAAFALYTAHRGERPVKAMIYTHSHVDHFGGVKGIITEEQVAAGDTVVIAPEGFMQHAISENVFAGTAMTRRAAYMYGALLERGPAGQIGTGLGQTTSTGSVSLIAPTIDITHTGQRLTIDGVEIEFQVTPGTEAPAEMNFYFPQRRALCTAENTSHTLHNVLTIRGALVRDAHAWAHYLTETISLWGDQLDVVFASHHWPTWGRERAVEFLAMQRDMYLYLHDQTLRMINQGYTGAEIAEVLPMPPVLEQQWHTHGYYGSVSHNVKAIYQRYMGWYDANPANLWPHPPEAVAPRYVDAMGGRDGALAVARRAWDAGDYRWCAEVGKHLVFADDTDTEARELLADAFEQLAYGAENGTWRNAFLAGATELRSGNFGTPVSTGGELLRALTVTQVLDSIAIRIDGPKAWDEHLQIAWRITDEDRTYLVELRNGVMHHRTVDAPPTGVTTFSLPRPALIGLVTGALDLGAAMGDGTVVVDGDASVLGRLVGLLAPVDPAFDIVTP